MKCVCNRCQVHLLRLNRVLVSAHTPRHNHTGDGGEVIRTPSWPPCASPGEIELMSYQINFPKCLDATAKMLKASSRWPIGKGRTGSLLRARAVIGHRSPSQIVKQLICYKRDLCNLGHRSLLFHHHGVDLGFMFCV